MNAPLPKETPLNELDREFTCLWREIRKHLDAQPECVCDVEGAYRRTYEASVKLMQENIGLTAERDQYKQKLLEAEQLAVRQANEIRSMRRVGLRPFRGSKT